MGGVGELEEGQGGGWEDGIGREEGRWREKEGGGRRRRARGGWEEGGRRAEGGRRDSDWSFSLSVQFFQKVLF